MSTVYHQTNYSSIVDMIRSAPPTDYTSLYATQSFMLACFQLIEFGSLLPLLPKVRENAMRSQTALFGMTLLAKAVSLMNTCAATQSVISFDYDGQSCTVLSTVFTNEGANLSSLLSESLRLICSNVIIMTLFSVYDASLKLKKEHTLLPKLMSANVIIACIITATALVFSIVNPTTGAIIFLVGDVMDILIAASLCYVLQSVKSELMKDISKRLFRLKLFEASTLVLSAVWVSTAMQTVYISDQCTVVCGSAHSVSGIVITILLLISTAGRDVCEFAALYWLSSHHHMKRTPRPAEPAGTTQDDSSNNNNTDKLDKIVSKNNDNVASTNSSVKVKADVLPSRVSPTDT